MFSTHFFYYSSGFFFVAFLFVCLPKGTQTTSTRHQAESGILQ